jgi:TRAP-type C4-dicarboxylate transport system permease small subunit
LEGALARKTQKETYAHRKNQVLSNMSKGIEAGQRALCLISMFGILIVAVLTFIDVFMRYIFSSPIPGIPEVNTVLFVSAIFLSLAYTQSRKGHIKVEPIELLIQARQPRLGRIIRISMLILALLIVCLLTWKTGEMGISSTKIQEIQYGAVPVPIWPAKLLLPIGAFLLCIQLAIDILRSVRG